MGMQSSRRQPAASLSERITASARAHPTLSLALIVLAAGAAYMAVTVAWPGRRARTAAVVDAVAVAVREGDVAGVMEHLSADFSSDGIGRDSLKEALTEVLRDRPLVRVNVSIREVQVEHGKASVKVHVTSRYELHGHSGLNMSEWLVVLEQVDGRWLIVGGRPVYVGGRTAAALSAVLRAGRRRNARGPSAVAPTGVVRQASGQGAGVQFAGLNGSLTGWRGRLWEASA